LQLSAPATPPATSAPSLPGSPPAPPPPLQPPPPAPPAPEPPTPPPPALSLWKPLVVRVEAAGWGGYAPVAGAVFGLVVGAGARFGKGPVVGQAQWLPPAGWTFPNGQYVRVGLVTGGLLLCGHPNVFIACLAGEAGELQAFGTWQLSHVFV